MDDDNKLDAPRRIEALNSALDAIVNEEPLSGLPAVETMFAITREVARIESIGRKGRTPRKIFGFFTPQFEIAMKYETGTISYDDATHQLCELCFCEKRTAQKHLSEMRLRAKKLLYGDN